MSEQGEIMSESSETPKAEDKGLRDFKFKFNDFILEQDSSSLEAGEVKTPPQSPKVQVSKLADPTGDNKPTSRESNNGTRCEDEDEWDIESIANVKPSTDSAKNEKPSQKRRVSPISFSLSPSPNPSRENPFLRGAGPNSAPQHRRLPPFQGDTGYGGPRYFKPRGERFFHRGRSMPFMQRHGHPHQPRHSMSFRMPGPMPGPMMHHIRPPAPPAPGNFESDLQAYRESREETKSFERRRTQSTDSRDGSTRSMWTKTLPSISYSLSPNSSTLDKHLKKKKKRSEKRSEKLLKKRKEKLQKDMSRSRSSIYTSKESVASVDAAVDEPEDKKDKKKQKKEGKTRKKKAKEKKKLRQSTSNESIIEDEDQKKPSEKEKTAEECEKEEIEGLEKKAKELEAELKAEKTERERELIEETLKVSKEQKTEKVESCSPLVDRCATPPLDPKIIQFSLKSRCLGQSPLGLKHREEENEAKAEAEEKKSKTSPLKDRKPKENSKTSKSSDKRPSRSRTPPRVKDDKSHHEKNAKSSGSEDRHGMKMPKSCTPPRDQFRSEREKYRKPERSEKTRERTTTPPLSGVPLNPFTDRNRSPQWNYSRGRNRNSFPKRSRTPPLHGWGEGKSTTKHYRGFTQDRESGERKRDSRSRERNTNVRDLVGKLRVISDERRKFRETPERKRSTDRDRERPQSKEGRNSRLRESYDRATRSEKRSESLEKRTKGKRSESVEKRTKERKLSRETHERKEKDKSQERKLQPYSSPRESEKSRLSESRESKEKSTKKEQRKDKINQRALSFPANEFTFPEDEETEEEDFTLAKEEAISEIKKSPAPFKKGKTSDSPDTNDYMEDWEHESTGDENSQQTTQSSGSIGSSKSAEKESKTPPPREQKQPDDDEAIEDGFSTPLFVNPSPPRELLCQTQVLESKEVENEPTKPTQEVTSLSNEPKTPPIPTVIPVTQAESPGRQKSDEPRKVLFGMQDLYNQFMKSVEASGIELDVGNQPETPKDLPTKPETTEEDASPTSSSSSSSSSSDDSSSSSDESSSTSSSSSVHSGADKNFDNFEIETRSEAQADKSGDDDGVQTPPIASGSQYDAFSQQDQEKIKRLEENLSRIRYMRENYDSGDEICDELAVMENLILSEKNIIVQKYATAVKTIGAESSPVKQFISTLQRTDTGGGGDDSTIFDSERKTIKLTISPKKQPAGKAEKDAGKNAKLVKKKDEEDEFDFTEKFVKTEVKEVPNEQEKVSKEKAEKHVTPSSPKAERKQPQEADRRRHSPSPRRAHRHRTSSPSSPIRRGLRRGGGRGGHRWRARRSRSRSLSPVKRSQRSASPFNRRRGHPSRGRRMRSRSPRSPRSPPPRLPSRRLRSRSRGFSRSPLPFKPPSPPTRRTYSRSRSRSPPPFDYHTQQTPQTFYPPNGFYYNPELNGTSYNYQYYGYMSMPPQPDTVSTPSYPMTYPNQYMSNEPPPLEAYSKIPTIGSTGTSYSPINAPSGPTPILPTGSGGVNQSNIVEIVPVATIAPSATVSSSSAEDKKPTAQVQKRRRSFLGTHIDEVTNRHIQSAVLRLRREKDGKDHGILKKTTMPATDSPKQKKKVLFGDGVFPNMESEDEDRKLVEALVQQRIKKLKKRQGIKRTKMDKENIDVDPALLDAPPPPAPPGSPPPHLEQPELIRPPSPAMWIYFHFDAAVGSMYYSFSRTPMPPRLFSHKPPAQLVNPTTPTPTGVIMAQSPTVENLRFEAKPSSGRSSPALVRLGSPIPILNRPSTPVGQFSSPRSNSAFVRLPLPPPSPALTQFIRPIQSIVSGYTQDPPPVGTHASPYAHHPAQRISTTYNIPATYTHPHSLSYPPPIGIVPPMFRNLPPPLQPPTTAPRPTESPSTTTSARKFTRFTD